MSWLAGRLFALFSGCSALFCDRGRDCLALTGRSVGNILDLSPFSCILVGSLFAGYKVNMITSVCKYLNISCFFYNFGQVPVVRGATLATHIFKSANPVIKPYCLSNIAGQTVGFECPVERSGTGQMLYSHLSQVSNVEYIKIYLSNVPFISTRHSELKVKTP